MIVGNQVSLPKIGLPKSEWLKELSKKYELHLYERNKEGLFNIYATLTVKN